MGVEADDEGAQQVVDRVKQALRLETDRGVALRQAILACRKGGVLSIMGAYGVMDTFPLGAIMNRGLTIRTGQQHGQRYLPRLLDLASRGEFVTSYLATHVMPLEDAVRGYELFKDKEDGCVRAVFQPSPS